jgi:hypothetical protein
VTEQEILAAVDQIETEMVQKFTKVYSSARITQLVSHLATVKMVVTAAFAEEAQEEDPTRKESVVDRMVHLDHRGIADAQAAVERGER